MLKLTYTLELTLEKYPGNVENVHTSTLMCLIDATKEWCTFENLSGNKVNSLKN